MIGCTGEVPLRTARLTDSGRSPHLDASSSVVSVRRPVADVTSAGSDEAAL
ncbi:MAG: hypothetical protein JWN62_159 [Acidimicrobiales bacterium]|nr:hypothetical protein [Acidimicrobiales bacterium]